MSQENKPKLFLEIARAAVSKGLKVVPLHPGKKEPVFLDWTSLASNDDSQLIAWSEKNPSYNCGSVCSPQSCLILDFDNAVWMMENWPHSKMPETLIVRTGSGGCQMRFSPTDLSREKLRNSAIPNPRSSEPGQSKNVLEVLADRRQGLVAGCLHPNGKYYELVKDSPLAPIPDYVVEWIVSLLSPKLRSTVGKARPIKPGSNLDLILSSAGLKFQKVERDGKVYFNYHDIMGKCLVKGERHSNDKSAFVFNTANGELWHQCFSAGCASFSHRTELALAAIGLRLEDLVMEKWRRLFESKGDFEAAGNLKPVIEGWCNIGEITGYAALQKNGKSWLMGSRHRALLSGNPWFGRKVEKAERVIYLVPEVGRSSVYSRLKKLELDQYLDKTLFVRTSALGVPDLVDEELLEACQGADVSLDTLIRFIDGPENNAEVIKHLAEKLFAIGAVARQVEFNAHTQKSYSKAEDMGPDMFRGSGDITAFASNGYGSMQVDEPSNRIYVKALFSRDLEGTRPMLLEGRPWIDKEHDFRLLSDDAGTLAEHKSKGGNPGDPDKPAKMAWMEEKRKVDVLSQSWGPKSWATALDEKFPSKKHSENTVKNWLKEIKQGF